MPRSDSLDLAGQCPLDKSREVALQATHIASLNGNDAMPKLPPLPSRPRMTEVSGKPMKSDRTQLPLKGRAALITGVSRRIGIGFAIAQRLAALGADLCLHSYSAYDAEQPWGADVDGPLALANELRHHGGRVVLIESDLCEANEPERAVGAGASAFGHLDILVVNHAHGTIGELEHMTASHIDRHLTVNVRASLLLVKAFAASHDGREGGRVILMTSGQHLGPMQTELAYAASKGALHQITMSLAAHLAPRRITVNAVNPGATDTGYATSAAYEAVRASEPMGRWGTPTDAARLIGWLVTDEGPWITGQVLNSTGGGP